MSTHEPIPVELGPPLPRGMPDPGLIARPDALVDALAMRAWLAIAAPRFVMLEVAPSGAEVGALQRLHRLAGSLEAAAILRVSGAEAGRTDYAALVRAVADAKLRLDRVVLCAVAGPDDGADDVARARATMTGIRVEVDGHATVVAAPPEAVASADVTGTLAEEGLGRASALLSAYAQHARGGARGIALCAPEDLIRMTPSGARATESFHVFAGLSRAAGTTRFDVVAPPETVEAIAHRVNGGLRVWLGNRSRHPIRVRVGGLPRGIARLRVLETAPDPATEEAERSFDEAARPIDPSLPIDLSPHALAVLEIAITNTIRRHHVA